MTKSSTNPKKERNDVYTSFAVLSLFLFFGFFLLRSNDNSAEKANEWIAQPVAPNSFSGFPYPHDDQSIEEAFPILEEIDPLPQRRLKPVSSEAVSRTSEVVKPVALEGTVIIKDKELSPVTRAVKPSLVPVEIEKELPSLDPSPTQADVETAVPKVKAQLKEKLSSTVPAVAPKAAPVTPKSAQVSAKKKGISYISSELPCVWVVGVFKDAKNVARVVERLRLNTFAAATGAHEKGTYVGVPCACSGEQAKAAQLREIFAAQPWLLRK